jgi:hypothetical protein
METTTTTRSDWQLRQYSSHEEQRCAQIRDWQALSGAARRAAAWELVTHYWVNQKNTHPDELRLQRSITNITRL